MTSRLPTGFQLQRAAELFISRNFEQARLLCEKMLSDCSTLLKSSGNAGDAHQLYKAITLLYLRIAMETDLTDEATQKLYTFIDSCFGLSDEINLACMRVLIQRQNYSKASFWFESIMASQDDDYFNRISQRTGPEYDQYERLVELYAVHIPRQQKQDTDALLDFLSMNDFLDARKKQIYINVIKERLNRQSKPAAAPQTPATASKQHKSQDSARDQPKADSAESANLTNKSQSEKVDPVKANNQSQTPGPQKVVPTKTSVLPGSSVSTSPTRRLNPFLLGLPAFFIPIIVILVFSWGQRRRRPNGAPSFWDRLMASAWSLFKMGTSPTSL
ncbi:hypothetical protein HDU76_011986 [Blyttiomyces sp. JEL0837]|nr:hypothetical protein HDU76_011986 [Blyttiomyces sp. JEL0837]